jgi:hypothetical protein
MSRAFALPRARAPRDVKTVRRNQSSRWLVPELAFVPASLRRATIHGQGELRQKVVHELAVSIQPQRELRVLRPQAIDALQKVHVVRHRHPGTAYRVAPATKPQNWRQGISPVPGPGRRLTGDGRLERAPLAGPWRPWCGRGGCAWRSRTRSRCPGGAHTDQVRPPLRRSRAHRSWLGRCGLPAVSNPARPAPATAPLQRPHLARLDQGTRVWAPSSCD